MKIVKLPVNTEYSTIPIRFGVKSQLSVDLSSDVLGGGGGVLQ